MKRTNLNSNQMKSSHKSQTLTSALLAASSINRLIRYCMIMEKIESFWNPVKSVQIQEVEPHLYKFNSFITSTYIESSRKICGISIIISWSLMYFHKMACQIRWPFNLCRSRFKCTTCQQVPWQKKSRERNRKLHCWIYRVRSQEQLELPSFIY